MSSTNHISFPSNSTTTTTGSTASAFFSETNSEHSFTSTLARKIDEKEAHRQDICKKFDASASWKWLVENGDLIVNQINQKLHSGGVAIITEFSDNKVQLFSQIGYGKKRSLKRQVALANQIFACDGQGFIVEDATKDRKCKANPYVTGFPHIRFYCCTPLKTPCGQIFGALEIYDTIACYETSEFEQILLQVANQIQRSLRPASGKQIHQQEPENATSDLSQLPKPRPLPLPPKIRHSQHDVESASDPCVPSQMSRGGNFFSSKIFAAPKSRPSAKPTSQHIPESNGRDPISFLEYESHHSTATSSRMSYKHRDPSFHQPSCSEPEDPDETLKPRDRTRQPKDIPWSIESDDPDETIIARDRSPHPEDVRWSSEANLLVSYSSNHTHQKQISWTRNPTNDEFALKGRNHEKNKLSELDREMINNFVLTRRQRLNREKKRGLDWMPMSDAEKKEERSFAEDALAEYKAEKLRKAKQGSMSKVKEGQSSKFLSNQSPRQGLPVSRSIRDIQHGDGTEEEQRQQLQQFRYPQPSQESVQLQSRDKPQQVMGPPLRHGQSSRQNGHATRSSHSSNHGLETQHRKLSIDHPALDHPEHQVEPKFRHKSSHSHHESLSGPDVARVPHESHPSQTVPLHQREFAAPATMYTGQRSSRPDPENTRSHRTQLPLQTAPIYQEEFKARVDSSSSQNASRPDPDTDRPFRGINRSQTAPMHQGQFTASIPENSTRDRDRSHSNSKQSHAVPRMPHPSQTVPVRQGEFAAHGRIVPPGHRPGRSSPQFDRTPAGSSTRVASGDSRNERSGGITPTQGPRRTTVSTHQEVPESSLPAPRRPSNSSHGLANTSSLAMHRNQKESTSGSTGMNGLPMCPDSMAMLENMETIFKKPASGTHMLQVLRSKTTGVMYQWIVSADGTRLELREYDGMPVDDYPDSLDPAKPDDGPAPFRLADKLKKQILTLGGKADKKAAKEKALLTEQQRDYYKLKLENEEKERKRLEVLFKARDQADRLARRTTDPLTPDPSKEQDGFPVADSPETKPMASSGSPSPPQ